MPIFYSRKSTGTTSSTTGGYVKPSGGIPLSDLSAAVRESLAKADTAISTD